jgi:hypothetical protein
VGAVEIGIAGVPLAAINVLFRPFPWEADNIMVLVSSLEILGFWCIAWLRRKRLLASLRHWRTDPLLRLSLPFILVYSIALGMMMSNMGIIARQRVFLFPFLFLLLEAAPRKKKAPHESSVALSLHPVVSQPQEPFGVRT